MEQPNKLEQQPSVESSKKVDKEKLIKTENVTLNDRGGDYVEFEKKLYKQQALQELRPDLFKLTADSLNQVSSSFGTSFPRIAQKGSIFVRVDVLPNRVYKFDGYKWLEQNKQVSQTYLDTDYIDYLINKIGTGEYDLELLTDYEKTEVETRLKNQNT